MTASEFRSQRWIQCVGLKVHFPTCDILNMKPKRMRTTLKHAQVHTNCHHNQRGMMKQKKRAAEHHWRVAIGTQQNGARCRAFYERTWTGDAGLERKQRPP